jgi:ABC-type Fe3+/spermidine/putrescine transport system ATPase subunit
VTTAAPFIEVRNLTKRYGDATVVDGVSFAAARGEFLTFLGPSGCGKTTTLRCVGGFIDPDGGVVRIADQDMTGMPPYRRHLGMVFQNYALFPHLTAFENVAFGLRIRNVSGTAVAQRVERALEMVRLGGLGARYPKQLSGGQQQRVALARALVYEPRVLLLDEPLSNLDAKLRVEMRSEIRSLQRELGVTALYVTHDQEEALSISDRVVVMNAGRIEQLSSPWDLYNRPQTLFVASFVGTANVLPTKAVNGEAGTPALRVAECFDVPRPREQLPGGNSPWFVARPEGITIRRDTGDAILPYSARAKIRSVTMLGPTMRADVAISDAAHVLVDLPHGGAIPDLSPGDGIVVQFDASRIVFIPR